MRRAIRSRSTGLFLANEGWTAEVQKARTFFDPDDALQTSNDLHLQGVEIYYCFGKDGGSFTEWDFAVLIQSPCESLVCKVQQEKLEVWT
jgi:hypothetical protein